MRKNAGLRRGVVWLVIRTDHAARRKTSIKTDHMDCVRIQVIDYTRAVRRRERKYSAEEAQRTVRDRES